MLDGQFRATFERGMRPVGRNIRRTGITADHLTATGVVLAGAAAVAIANGALRAGLLLMVLCAVPDLLDGAVAKASGTASPRGAFFDSVSDRVTELQRASHSAESTISRSATSMSCSNSGFPNGGLPRQRRNAGKSGSSSDTTTLPGTFAVPPRSHRCTTSAQTLRSLPGRSS